MEPASHVDPFPQAQSEEPPDLVKVHVLFKYRGDEWSHSFKIAKGSTVSALKQAMVSPGSPKEDQISFDLCKQRLRLSNLDTVDEDEDLEFRFLGVEEGQRLFQRDLDVREREEEAARLSRERERQRQEAEQRQREEAQLRAAQEEQERLCRPPSPPPALPEAKPEAGDEVAAPRAEVVATTPKPEAAAAVPKPLGQQGTKPEETPMTWVWTHKGLEAIVHVAHTYGNPKIDEPFTEAHMRLVLATNPGAMITYLSLATEGLIRYEKRVDKEPATMITPQELPRVSCRVTQKGSQQSVPLALPPGQTILDLKKAISAEVGRGPFSKLTLTYKTGKLLGDMTRVDGLSAEDRDGLVASGLDLGPPVTVEVKVVHAGKAAAGASVMVAVEDTATFQDLKKALCDKLGGKTTEVRLMTKKPGSANLVGCKDSDRLNGLREVGAAGRLMDRMSAG